MTRTISRSLMLRAVCAACGVGGAGFLVGCASAPDEVEYARAYPEALTRADTLNIQVVLEPKHIEFTNTTARSFGPSTIWLNGRYSRPIDGLAPGESKRLKLHDFRDLYSDPFRGGGFFATEKPQRLVMAEIESPPLLYGLIVVGGDPEAD